MESPVKLIVTCHNGHEHTMPSGSGNDFPACWCGLETKPKTLVFETEQGEVEMPGDVRIGKDASKGILPK